MKHLWIAGWLMTLAVAAQADDYTCATNLDNTITIQAYTGPGGNVVIPSETNGLPVTGIGNRAFYGKSSLTSVTITSNITHIGSQAFKFCSGLTNLMLGVNVTSIGDYAFQSCSSLRIITIPAGVTVIGDYAFQSCPSLAEITVDATNEFYSSADGFLIDPINNRIIQCPGGKAGIITVPDGITTIGAWSFYDCINISRINVPASITNIEEYAFYYCTGLTTLYFDGDAPTLPAPDDSVFAGVTATVYYLPGTDGWISPFGGLTAVMLSPPQIQIVNPGFSGTNGFGFAVTGDSGTVVVVEACTNLAGGGWQALQTNTLSGDAFLFSDPQSTNHLRRFYRLLNREPSSL